MLTYTLRRVAEMCTKVTDNSALKVVVFLIKHKNYVTVVLRNRCEF